MILLWFFVGILIIFAIARYNESNKLFWLFLLSYVMGFAGTKMVYDTFSGDKQSNDDLVQVSSTQVMSTALSTATYFITDNKVDNNTMVTAFKPVSQGISPTIHKVDVTLSEVFGRTRDQPQSAQIKPPEYLETEVVNTS
jgi:hypothetical protein